VQIGNNENTFNWANLSPDKQELFIKCVLIIQYLSDEAVEEANEDLKRIINFYSEDLSNNYQTFLSTPQRTIKAKILPSKIRPSLVLDDF
jgi:hypothetical protein